MGRFTEAHAKWWDSNTKETERNDSKRKKILLGKLGLPSESEEDIENRPMSESEKKQVTNDMGLPYKKQPTEKQISPQTKKRVLDKIGLPSESEEDKENKPLSPKGKKQALRKMGFR